MPLGTSPWARQALREHLSGCADVVQHPALMALIPSAVGHPQYRSQASLHRDRPRVSLRRVEALRRQKAWLLLASVEER